MKSFAGIFVESELDCVGEIGRSNIGETAFLDGVGELEWSGELRGELVVIFLTDGGREELGGAVEIVGAEESIKEFFVILVG